MNPLETLQLIRISGLERHYQMGAEQVRAVDGVDLEIQLGDSIALLGPSGSGKSTLMHLLGALDQPTAGKIEVAGQALARMSEAQAAAYRNRNIGFVFQSFYLQPHFSALENVELPLKLAGLPRAERRRRAAEILRAVGLGDRLAHRPTELSGGQQQRVSIARALANDPQILLADEPTGNLDSRTGQEMIELFCRLQAQRGLTLILVTHDPEIAGRMARVVRMKDGKVVGDERKGEAAVAPRAGAMADFSAPRRLPVVDILRDVGLSLRRHRLRTALTGFGIAVGALAITLMVGLGLGLHDFILTQAESINDPLSLWVVNSRYSWQDIVGSRAEQLGKPPRKLQQKTLERMSTARSGFTPFTDAQVADLRKIPGVVGVRPRTYVIMDGLRLIAGGEEALDANRPATSDKTAGPNAFTEEYYIGYSLVRSGKASFRLAAGRAFREQRPRQVILSYQYSEAWQTTPEALVGREVEMLFPKLDQLGRFSWIMPKQIKATYRSYRATIVGVTRKSILSSVVLISPRFGEEITQFQFAGRLAASSGGMDGGNLAMVEQLMALSRLIGDAVLMEALRAGTAQEKQLAELLSGLAELPSRPEQNANAMLALMGRLAQLRGLLEQDALRETLRQGTPRKKRLYRLLEGMLALEQAPRASDSKRRPWGARLRVRVGSKAQLPAVRAEIERRGFKVRSLQENLALIGKVFSVIDAFLSSFGLIALFVAALGIANTLIMAVMERTQEIGVMKAVGATARRIRGLFALEALAIGLLGGVTGVAAGIGVGLAINRWGVQLIAADWQGFEFFSAPVHLLLGTVAFCTMVGLLAGLYPAHRAASLDPINALRSE